MNNRKFYNFDRNNYFYGKLLTSRDFSMEQEYMNNKRRLGNLMLNGKGIVSGLKVVAADETAVILQSGFAIDGGGREIVVPETEVIKLATIDGISDLKTDVAYLGISYKEMPAEQVYAVMQEEGHENESAYNHVKEGYKLRFYGEDACVGVSSKKDAWLEKTILFEDEDGIVTQEVCKYLTPNRTLAVYLTVEKKRQTRELLSVSYKLSVNGLSGQSFPITLENLNLDRYEKKTCVVELDLKDEVRLLKNFTLKVQNFEVRKDFNRCVTQTTEPVLVTCLEKDLLTEVLANDHKTAMDTVIENEYDSVIYLAKMDLIRMGDRVLLNRMEEVPFGQYVYTAQQLMLFEDLKKYCPAISEKAFDVTESAKEDFSVIPEIKGVNESGFVTGVFDLALGNSADTGKVFYSEEIMHGLGEGPVYVDIAYEVLNKEQGEVKEEIIFGDAELFGNTENAEKQLQISCGIKLLPERGTFIVAVKPKNKITKTSIRIRWYACKVEDTGKNITRNKEKKGMIVIAPDTLTTTPKGIVQIVPRFVNMPEQACRFEILDAAGGKIDSNGIYTAPTAEGVYEVRVSCISEPDIFAHAYIIVSANPRN